MLELGNIVLTNYRFHVSGNSSIVTAMNKLSPFLKPDIYNKS